MGVVLNALESGITARVSTIDFGECEVAESVENAGFGRRLWWMAAFDGER
jgi:hypothetical protein